MCMVSVIGDTYKDKWKDFTTYTTYPQIDRSEFDALRNEVLALKELLKAANKFDAATGQPHCEMDDKVALLKAVAKAVGVDLSEVFPPAKDNVP